MPGLLMRCGTEPRHQGWLQSLCSCLGIWKCLHFSAHFPPWRCWVGAEQCLGRAVSTPQFSWCSLLAEYLCCSLISLWNSQPAIVDLPRSELQVRSYLQRGSLARWPESLWCRTSGGGGWRNRHQCSSGFWLLPQFVRELQKASEQREQHWGKHANLLQSIWHWKWMGSVTIFYDPAKHAIMERADELSV